MRTAIGWNNAHVMDHLDKDSDISRPLHDLIIVVVETWQHRWTERRPNKAPLGQRPIFGTVELAAPILCSTVLLPLLRIGKHRRDSAVRRIHNQRGPQRFDNFRSAVVPSVVIRAANIRFSAAIAPVGIVPFDDLLFVRRRLLRREEGLVLKIRRTFQRRDGHIRPNSLKVRLADRPSQQSIGFRLPYLPYRARR